jgi:hypothetical protein
MNTRAVRDPAGTTDGERVLGAGSWVLGKDTRHPAPLVGMLLLLAWGAAAPAHAATRIINSPVTGPLTVNAGNRVEIYTGGSVTSATTGVIVNAGGELLIIGGAVSGGNGPGEISVFVHGGTLILSGGSVSGDYGVVVNSGTATLSGGSISGGLAGVIVHGGTATLSGGSVSGNRGVEVTGGKAILSGGSVRGGAIGVGVSGGTATMLGCNLHLAGTTLLGTLQDGTLINMPVSVAPPGQLILDSDATPITCPANQTVPATWAAGAVMNCPPRDRRQPLPGPVTVRYLPASGSTFREASDAPTHRAILDEPPRHRSSRRRRSSARRRPSGS